MSTTHPGDGVAVIGMAGRFPGAPNLEVFWENLRNGVESITHFSAKELDVPAALRDAPGYVRARAIIDDVDLFDAGFFGLQPREAQYTDPQHRLLLETAWEALEHAGCDPDRFEGAVGVFAGCSQNTYLLHNLASNPGFLAEYLASQQSGAHPALLGNDKDFLATRISYKLNLRGPSVTVQSACSTSLVAVCQAAQSLLTFGCDLALAGGVSVTFPQKRGYLYEEGSIVSRDGRCRPFDAAADGTVFGDGVGLVVLKRADEALRDGDSIYAIIRGFAVNNDGSDKVSYMAPSVEGQYEAIATAHALAGIEPATIRYVEAHGTGTALGDPIEVAALTKAFRGAGGKQFCTLGALKGNVGHLEVAAGVAGLIKAVLAVDHGEIPPTLNFSAPNPRIDFTQTPFQVASKLTQWPATIEPRRAGVSSFGVGGTNAHVVLEQAPPVTIPAHAPAPQLLVLSARTGPALDRMAERLRAHLERHPSVDLAGVAQTLQLGRRAFHVRRTLVARTAPEAVTLLSGRLPVAADTQGRTPPVAFLFPGQGAQAAGMGRALYESDELFRAEVDRACGLLQPELELDLRDVLFPRGNSPVAEAKLTQTALAQPALFVIEHALAQTWLARGVRPEIMAGHSLGEYVAAVLAGVFSLPDALHLLAVRGRLMQGLPEGHMLAVALPEEELAPHLTAEVGLAAVNGPRSCVVSGRPAALSGWRERLTAATGAACRELRTSHAFHSAMMEPILDEFEAEVARVSRQPSQIPIVSSLHGRLGTDDEWTSPTYWSAQLRRPVRFAEAMGALLVNPHRVFLEVGPGNTLSALARQHPAWQQDRVATPSLSRQSEEGLLAATGVLWQAGVPVNFQPLHAVPRRVALPTYPFERQRYWIERVAAGTAPPAPAPVPEAPSAPAGRAAVERLIDEQMRVMARQLEILRTVPTNGRYS